MGTSKENVIVRGLQFVKESKNELRKVSWPPRKETTAITMVVIVAVFVVGFYLATMDWIFSSAIKYLVGVGSGI